MRITYRHKYDKTKPCVAKLWFGPQYFIMKSADIATSAKTFIDLVVKNEWPGIPEYAPRRTRTAIQETSAAGKPCVIEIVYSTNRGEELLAKEQVLLNQKTKECLNSNKVTSRPSWIYTLMPEAPKAPGLFKLKGRHRAVPAVVLLWVGEKYFIWKCKDIQEFADKFSTSMQANISNEDERSYGVLNPLVVYMRTVPALQGIIEVLYKGECSTKGVKKLLSTEKRYLQKFVRKPNCLNRSVVPYLPVWIKELQEAPKKATT